MGSHRLGLLGIVFITLAGVTARAEVKTSVNHNVGEDATAEFKFKDVPAPAKVDSAPKAKFTIVDGDRDENGGEIAVIHDGKVPADKDAPADNFFFNQGGDGGRIGADLGEVIEIKQINSYSWHTDTRAAQVYKLYASDGTSKDFKADPKKETDPATVGWQLIASVDTRPKEGAAGGQFGVSIADANGTLGKFRYLLFDISRTEGDDTFGNTFFSEISIIAPNWTPAATQPVDTTPRVTRFEFDGKYTCTISTADAPELTDWANATVVPLVKEWYPRIVAMLPSDGFEAPPKFSIAFTPKYKGVAATGGTGIVGSSAWFAKGDHQDDLGAIVHEMVHVVQQYGRARRTNPNAERPPGWLVEGIPDYIRWYHFEPTPRGAEIRRNALIRARFDGSYRISANFLNFVVTKYERDLIVELNAALRSGTYQSTVWKTLTGKTVDELNDEWKAALDKQ